MDVGDKRSSIGSASARGTPLAHEKHEEVTYSEEEKKAVLRTMDWHLLPFISFLYLLSFL